MTRLSIKQSWSVGLLLFVLMIVTRSSHFGSGFDLPDASLAVFLFAGFYFRSPWVFAVFLAEAALSDYYAIHARGVSDWCVSPAYFFLIPTYGVLWLAGRWLHRYWHSSWRLLMLSAAASLSVTIAFHLSSGSFYFLSGRYPDPTWAEYVTRIDQYYWPYVFYAGFYIAVILALLFGMQALLSSVNERREIGE